MAQTWGTAHLSNNISLSSDKLTATNISAGDGPGVGTESVTSGKYYWEIVFNAFTDINTNGVGIGNINISLVLTLGDDANGIGLMAAGYFRVNGSFPSGPAFTSGARIGFALDVGGATLQAINITASGSWLPVTPLAIPAGVLSGGVYPAYSVNTLGANAVAYFAQNSWVGIPLAGFGPFDTTGATVIADSASPAEISSTDITGVGTRTIWWRT